MNDLFPISENYITHLLWNDDVKIDNIFSVRCKKCGNKNLYFWQKLIKTLEYECYSCGVKDKI